MLWVPFPNETSMLWATDTHEYHVVMERYDWIHLDGRIRGWSNPIPVLTSRCRVVRFEGRSESMKRVSVKKPTSKRDHNFWSWSTLRVLAWLIGYFCILFNASYWISHERSRSSVQAVCRRRCACRWGRQETRTSVCGKNNKTIEWKSFFFFIPNLEHNKTNQNMIFSQFFPARQNPQ